MKAGKGTSRREPRARGSWLFPILITLAFLAVAGRLTQLQILEHREKAQEVVNTLYKTTTERDKRGSIIDSRGVPLAVSVPARACALDPKVLLEKEGARPEKLLKTLTEILSLTPAEVQKIEKGLAARHTPRNAPPEVKVPYRFLWVKRRITDAEYKVLADAMSQARRQASEAWKNRRRWLKLAGNRKVARDRENERKFLDYADGWRKVALDAEGRFAGLTFPPEYNRLYPQGHLASHVLGFGNIDGEGLEGVEKTCDSLLRGQSIRRLVARDARSRALSTLAVDNRSPNGMTVELTIDSVVQAIVEEELQGAVDKYKQEFPNVNAHAVVMDPNTGDILAIANYPTFDPNHPRFEADGKTKVEARARRNDAVIATQEPGSTFKPLLIAAALEEKVARLDEELDCGTFTMNNGRRKIKDIHPYGLLNLETALVKSSNPAMVRIGLRLGPEKMREYVLRWGFGEKTGLGLPGEEKGKVTSQRRWSEWTMGSVPMGYEVNVTTMQMAAAYSALANGGMLPKPNLVKRIYDASGGLMLETQPQWRRRVISEKTAADIRQVLRKVVTDGTGRKANIPEYQLGGKTGTAEMIANKEEKKLNPKAGYSKTRHTTNFVALAPWNKPRAVICVSIRETGKYGGEAASPPGAAIARRLMGYWGVPTADGTPVTVDIMPKHVFEPAPVPAIYTVGDADDENRLDEEIDPRWMEEMPFDEEALG